MIEREDVGDVAVLRLAHGPVNAMDLELCQAASAQLRDQQLSVRDRVFDQQ